ncbi:MAG: sigma-70 family RNA polymerase sigma factor [Planctomycetaceae bacterium]|nr:sigma-70 family RNA polymerase sigma factor [Planctomycetaceae bacterium]
MPIWSEVLTPTVEDCLRAELNRLPFGTWDDFGQLVVLELLESNRQRRWTEEASVRAIWRVSKRLSRAARKTATRPIPLDVEVGPDESAEMRDSLLQLLGTLSDTELVVVQLAAEGKQPVEIGKAMGVSASTIRRMLRRLRSTMRDRSE